MQRLKTKFRDLPVILKLAHIFMTVFENPAVRKVRAGWGRCVSRIRKLQSRPLLFSIGWSFVLYMILEMLGRRSFFAAFTYLLHEPIVFISNWLIVLLTMSLTLLFRKREFVFVIITVIWLILGGTNFVLLGFRTTPLNFMDFRTFKDVMGILNVYLTQIEIVGIAIFLAVLLILGVRLFIRAPKERPHYLKSVTSIAGIAILLGISTSVSVSSGLLATTFHNIQDAYKDYGFAYCFAASVVDRGISRPDAYTEESVQVVLDKIEAAGGDLNAGVVPAESATEETPNIIFLQLESFFDVNHLKDVTYSENPLPNWTAIKESYSSGLLTTPSFGAGTVNTEFEILTGMQMNYFGPGEYPYTTILREHTSESVCNDLKNYGYATHAIHNHTGKFYGRYLVYPHLGFDSFTSVEYMQNIIRNPLNWVEDSILTGEITKTMDSTANQDFVFAVSVQGHGKYPTEQIDPTQTITVEGFREEEAVGFEYYVNQISRMDAFLGELTATLQECGEPTVLVAYGDHMPKFTFEPDDLDNGNIYQTEYIIWDNFGLEQKDRDLNTYELYPEVMNQLNMHAGIVTQFQQYLQEDPTYFEDLHTLQYDILYGKNWSYGGENPFVRTDMQMGIDPITLRSMNVVGDRLYISGDNLTYASKIFINGEQVGTTFLSPRMISTSKGDTLEDGDQIEVIQMSSRKTHLSTTGTWIWRADGAAPEEDVEEGRNLAEQTEESQSSIDADIEIEENQN